MTDTEKLTSDLVAAHSLLVEKIGRQPFIGFELRLAQSGKWIVGGAYLDADMKQRLSGPFCDTPSDAIAGVIETIRRLPSKHQRDIQEFQRKVAEAIDFGNEHGIEAQWLNPLIDTARKLAENAITHEVAP